MPSTVTVELDISSGRPNPTWPLTGATAEQFRTRLQALPAGSPFEPANPLGYRGFVARWTEGSRQDVVVVQAGRVLWTAGREVTYRSDPQRGLERWLLGTGRSRLDAGTRAAVEHALAE